MEEKVPLVIGGVYKGNNRHKVKVINAGIFRNRQAITVKDNDYPNSYIYIYCNDWDLYVETYNLRLLSTEEGWD